jgi:hypothetical protein
VDDDGHQNQSDVAGNTERLKECTEKVQPPQLAGASNLQDQAAMPGNDRPDGSSTACKHASAKIDNLRSEIATLAAACSNEADEDFQWFCAALKRKRLELEALVPAECQQLMRRGG